MENGVKNNKLMIVLISLVSVACLGIGVIIYNGFVNKKDDTIVEASSDAVAQSKAMLTSKNTSVDNNIKLEDTYHILITSYIEKMMEFNRSTYENIQSKNVTDSNKDDLIIIANSFLTYSQSFSATPNTESDKIMNESFIDMKYDAEKVAEYALQYIYKKEDVYRSLHQDYFDNLRIHVSTMGDIENKYYK